MGLFHIRFGLRNPREAFDFVAGRPGVPLPLFLRDKTDSTSHQPMVDGWYWNPEAALVWNHPDADFVEAWIFEDDGSYPFWWIDRVYESRKELSANDDPTEKLIKWALAALWGRAAQHAGWNKKSRLPPPSFQIEWAGWATSYIRARVFRCALAVSRSGGLVSIDADGILSTTPFPPGIQNGDKLGDWKLSTYSAILYVGNGIYWTKNHDGEWNPPKFRGTPRGMYRDVSTVWDVLESGERVLHLVRHSFVGYGQIKLRGREDWRKWVSIPYTVTLERSKYRDHVPRFCRACRAGVGLTEGLHDLVLVPAGEVVSRPAPLPWHKDPDSIKAKMLHEVATEFI